MFLSLRTSADTFEHWYEPKLGRNKERRENGQSVKNSSGEVNSQPSATTNSVIVYQVIHEI